jgi:hypothetical protein
MTKVLPLANYAFEVPAAIETRLEEDDTMLVVEVPGGGGQVLRVEHLVPSRRPRRIWLVFCATKP